MPRVTVDFWIIKLMAVTMGETAADYLAINLGLGLTTTSLIMAVLLAVGIVIQFAQKQYIPYVYWAAVVMISIVGTLVTDNLVDTFGVSFETIHQQNTGYAADNWCRRLSNLAEIEELLVPS